MAGSEGSWAESTSVLGTKPRTREEVREEVREEIRLLDLSRPTPEEKLRLEREAVLASVGDVELFEKSWRKTSPETLAEIQRKVDALDLGGVRGPAAVRPIPAPRSVPKPDDAEPWEAATAPKPARGGGKVSGRLTPSEQKAIAKHLGGTVQRATVLFATTRGRVVEVTHKAGETARTTMLLVGDGGHVSTMDEIGARLDALPMPVAAPASADDEPAAIAGSAAAEPPRERAPGRTDLVEAIEGIGEVYGRKLEASGVTTLEQFAASDPATLAAETGIGPELLRKWHAMAKLQAIRGVGPQYSELLVRAGVTSAGQLAAHDADDLARKLAKYESALEKRVTGATITPALVQRWIDAARDVAPPPAPAARDPEPAEGAAEPAAPGKAKKKFGLQLAKKPARKAPAAPPAGSAAEPAAQSDEPAAARKKFGFKLRKG